MSEFKNQKGAFQRSLEKEFMASIDTYKLDSPVTFEKFKKVIVDIQMGGLESDEYFDPLTQFTGEISLIRAYIFCLTAGEGNND
jgi:hypothetical protein